MSSVRSFTSAAVVALLLVAAGCGGGHGGGASTEGTSPQPLPSSVSATVGDQTISAAEVNALLAQAQHRNASVANPFPKRGSRQYRQVRMKALRYLVTQAEYQQKLTALGGKLPTAHDVDVKLAQVKKQLFGLQPSHYKPELAREGLTEQQLKQDLYDGLVQDRLFALATAKTTVTNADVERAYNGNKTTFVRPVTRRLRHILVSSKALADELEAQLKNGADFATLAKKYSKDAASAPVGGNVTITKGHSIPEFEKAAFALKVGEISEPVQTRYGWHIIQALAPATSGGETPLSSVSARLRSSLLKTKKQADWKAFLTDLQKEYAESVHYQSG
jgi:parvulin-like peptidyl-prolyl isomerase